MSKRIIMAAKKGAVDMTSTLKSMLVDSGLEFRELQGCYTYESGEREIEESFEVQVNSQSMYAMLLRLAFHLYNQESVLLLDEFNNATLLFASGKVDSIGVFTEVDKNEALANDNYSRCYNTAKYYICK